MSHINEKIEFLALFTPPEGYKTDFVEMTTFSLDLNFLCLIPALIYAGNLGYISDKNELLQENISVLLHNSQKEREKNGEEERFRLLYDKKQLLPTAPDSEISFLEYGEVLLAERCRGVQNKGYFHPKIMLFQFKNSGKEGERAEYRYRLFIGSRNLVFSNYFETGVCLELELDKYAEEEKANLELQKVRTFFEKQWETGITCKIDWDIFEKTKLPKGVEIHFTEGETTQPHFLYDKITKDAQNATDFHITSMNPTDFWSMGNTTPPSLPKTCYIANPVDVFKSKNPPQTSSPPTPMVCLQRVVQIDGTTSTPHKFQLLHGKSYQIYNGNRQITWIGSANCSRNALCTLNNTEVMVRLETDATSVPSVKPSKSDDGSKYGTFHPFFYVNQEKTMQYIYNEQGEDTQPPDEEEPQQSPPKLECKGVIYEENQKYVTITLKNEEKEALSFSFLGKKRPKEDGDWKIEGGGQETEFCVHLHCFSSVISVKKGEKYFLFPLKVGAVSGLMDKLKENISFSDLDYWEVKDLIPRGSNHNPTDQAFERLMLHQQKGESYFASILEIVLQNIEGKKELYHKVFPTVAKVSSEEKKGFMDYYLLHPPKDAPQDWKETTGAEHCYLANHYREQFDKVAQLEELVKKFQEKIQQ